MFNLNTVQFGIGIECFGQHDKIIIAQAIDNLPNCKCIISSTAYSHRNSATFWQVTSDSTIRPNTPDQITMEIVSPIMIGQAGLDQLTSVVNLLNTLNFEVNDSCGLHVHIDATDLYNPYATIDELVRTISTRYKAINTQSYLRHGTVEFRQHEATLNLKTITNWITYLACLVYDADHKTQASMPESSSIVKSNDFTNLKKCKQAINDYLTTSDLVYKVTFDENPSILPYTGTPDEIIHSIAVCSWYNKQTSLDYMLGYASRLKILTAIDLDTTTYLTFLESLQFNDIITLSVVPKEVV